MQTSYSVVARCLIDSLTHDGILRLLPAYTPFFAPNHSFPELPTDQQHASHQQSSVLTAVHRAAADAAVCCCILVCCLGRDMPVTLPYAWKSIVWTKFDIQDGSIVWRSPAPTATTKHRWLLSAECKLHLAGLLHSLIVDTWVSLWNPNCT